MIKAGVRKFIFDTDRSAILNGDLMGFYVMETRSVLEFVAVKRCQFYVVRKRLEDFFNVKASQSVH